jgi:hypothetical protein
MKLRAGERVFSIKHYFILLVMVGNLLIPTNVASANITLPPKGVSQELWKAFQEIAISNIDGAERNLRWNTNPLFYIAGDPTTADNSAFQNTLFEIGSYCQNIKPFITAREPGEGVLFNYVPVNKFKSIITSTPSDVSTSYSWSLYYLNRGLTKFTAVFSTEMPQAERDYATRVRVLQGMGLRSKTDNPAARIFSWNFYNSSVLQASELDKQILRLYCSTYTRSWDSSQQTFDLISAAWAKKTAVPSLPLNIKVGEYKNQLNFNFNFDPSQALDNQVTGVQYFIYDSGGSLYTSGKVDVSENLFKTYEVILKGIKDNSRYRIEAFPLNSLGNGYVSRGEGRAGNLAAPTDYSGANAADASAEVSDARNAASDAIDSANEAISSFGRYRSACIEISLEFDTDLQELYDFTNLSQYCEQLDEVVAQLEAKVSALDPDEAKTTDQANEMTDQANLYSEEVDSYVAQIQDITDELLSSEKYFASLLLTFKPLNNLEMAVIDTWSSFQNRLDILPKSFVSNLKKNSNFKSGIAYVNQVQSLIKSRDIQIEALSNIEKPSQIPLILSKFGVLKISSTQLAQFRKSISALNKLVPPNVCQKGITVVLASKSGKCANGFEAIPTS